MQLPIVAPAPIVTAHADIFRDLFENRCQFRHFQNYLTGLIVLDNKSLANITRCVLESADKTNLSRFFSEAPWFQDRVQDRRLVYLLQQTKAVRSLKADALLILDDTLCEHVGSLFEYVDRHDNHGDGTYPLAHHPVTSFYVSGPVRFPSKSQLSSSFRLSPTAVSSALANHSACPLHSNNRAFIPVHTRLHDRISHLWDLGIARQCFLSR